MRVVLDLEADGLTPTKIWCIVCKDIDSGRVYEWGPEALQGFKTFAKRITFLVAHNGIDYDLPVLSRLMDVSFPQRIVFDTLVASRLMEFKLDGGHSLENWGNILHHPKLGLDIVEWSSYSPNMLVRCRCDVELCHKVYDHLLVKSRIDYKDAFREALILEHQIAWICREMQENGFGFDIQGATSLFQEIEGRCQTIDRALQEAFPPLLKTTQLKTKIREEWIPFNPNSPKQIVERLGPYWKPVEFTENKQAKISEGNLATLSEEAPEACKKLVERLLLSGRQRALTQWIEAYDPTTQRIHPRFLHIGTWTHRLGHRQPNLANVAAPKSIKYRGRALADMATAYGSRMRGLWKAAEGRSWLVGCDAEGIQLRVFGHYIDDKRFIESLVSGTKEQGTDPHSLNREALGVKSLTRDGAKTFIYAFLLGAGVPKLAEVLGCSSRNAVSARARFIEAYPGLRQLKERGIPEDARRGYFEGFDGRLIKCDSEHLMLAGYLQTGEVVIMKRACVIWRKELAKLEIPYKLCTWPHDEFQTEVFGSAAEAEAVGRVQADSIKQAGEYYGLRCPMAGSYKVGLDWMATH